MNQKTKLILSLGGFALFILVAFAGYRFLSGYVAPDNLQVVREPEPEIELEEEPAETLEEESQAEQERMIAPDFTAQDADGNQVRLSEMIGVPIVLNFWASWCPPCKAEMPDFEQVYQEYEPDELLFLMVNMTTPGTETVEDGKAYIEENGFTFPVWYDVEQEAAIAYVVRSIPNTYFINEEGELVAMAQGMIGEELLREGISRILT